MGKYGIIIQARTGSTRLPSKVILPFWQNKSIIDIIIEKLKQIEIPIVLATTKNEKDDVLCDIAQKHNIDSFRGDEQDVLSRFISVAHKFNFKRIIRVCADNPFIDIELLKYLVEKDKGDSDYTSFAFSDGKPVIKSHLGVFAEIAKTNALEIISESTDDCFFHEHVTNYLYTHPQKFTLNFLSLPQLLETSKEIRLTIDTENDFRLAQQIASNLNSVNLAATEISKYIKQNECFIKNMKMEIEKNGKQ